MLRDKKTLFFASGLILIGIAFRVLFIVLARPIDGDMAVLGVLAGRIADGNYFPVYIPMLHYAGTISAYIGAGLFKIFGASAFVYAFTGVILSSLWMVLVFLIAGRVCDSVGALFALAFVAIPPFKLLTYSVITALHAEGLVSISLVLFLLLKWVSDKKGGVISFILGLSCGFALWTTPAASPVILVVVITVIMDRRQRLLSTTNMLIVLGFFAGYMPALIYNIYNPFATFFRMAGKMFDLDRSVLGDPNLSTILVQRLFWKMSMVPASLARIPELTARLIGILNTAVFFAFFLWIVLKESIVLFYKKSQEKRFWIIIGYALLFITFYTVIVGLDGPRYLIPLCAVIPLFFGCGISYIAARSRPFAAIIMILILFYNICGTGYSFSESASARYATLIKWLSSEGLGKGFSDYYTAYIVQFESNEEVMLSPTLYHPTFSDRFPDDTARIRKSGRYFFLVDKRIRPQAQAIIEDVLDSKQISYRAHDIEDYVVYYDLSRDIYPEELALEKLVEDARRPGL